MRTVVPDRMMRASQTGVEPAMEDPNPYSALTALSDDLARITDALAPRMVTIDVGGRWTATGTLWRDGVVVTTAHAMRDTEHLRIVPHEGAPQPAVFGGWDLGTDLAVLKVEGLEVADPIGADVQAACAVRTGQLGVVIAGGAGGTSRARLTMVAGVGRIARLRRGARLARIIELDLAPFPGYSGGLLIDTRGRVVAINSAGIVRGAALAMPIDVVSPVIDALVVRGRVSRGYLGVGTYPVRSSRGDGADAAGGKGLLVHSLEPGGPAERARVLVGDILVSIEGRPLASPEQLVEELGGERVGESVRLGVNRGGNSIEIPVVVGERPERSRGRRRHAR
jgi:S1-C subfamily serine protease